MNILFYAIFFMLFFIMGALQFKGLSITKTSYSLILFVIFLLFNIFLIRKKFIINRYIMTNLCLLFLITISGIVNHTNPLLIINYFSYVIIPLSIYFFFRVVNTDTIKLMSVINILILIQLPVLCFQYLFPDYINFSMKLIDPLDRMFGTFPLSSDHFLSFFLIMNILYIGTRKSALTFFNYFIIIYSIICIFFTNSVTSYLILASSIVYIFIYRSNIYLKVSYFIIGIGTLLFLFYSVYDLLFLLNKPELLDMTNTSHISKGTAGRFQTLYFIFSDNLPVLGYGPSSYYNPFKEGFQLNLNFSQLLWFYYDLGILGFIFVILLIYSFLSVFNISNYLRLYLFFVILAYSFSSTIFDQVAFLFTLNIFAVMFEQRDKEIRI